MTKLLEKRLTLEGLEVGVLDEGDSEGISVNGGLAQAK